MNRQLLRKELREVWPIGLLAFLAAALIVMSDAELHPLTDPWRTAHAASSGGLSIPLIGLSYPLGPTAVVAGLILGLWQTWSETIRGTWGFLLHRPISRHSVLYHKLSVGIVVLLLAVGLPLAVLACWAVSPGHHVVGLEWRMGADAWAAVLAGTLAYLSAFLSGIRSARWWGSRYLVLGLGGAIVFLTIASGTIWGWAWLIIPVVDLLLVAAILHEAEQRNFSDS